MTPTQLTLAHNTEQEPTMKSPTINSARYTDRIGESPLTVKLVTITPEIASAWLESNPVNRNQNQKKINDYARDLRNGQWKLSGDTIRISSTDQLLDGQHRLLAVVKSGMAMPSLVVWGVEEAAQIVIDTGKPRSFSDHLKIRGESNNVNAAAVTRFLLRWGKGKRSGNRETSGSESYTIQELDAFYWKNRDRIQEVVNPGRRLAEKIPRTLSPAMFSGVYRILMDTDREDAVEFLRLMLLPTADLPSSSHPVAALITALERDREATTRHDDRWRMALVIKAWNLWRNGVEVSSLTFRAGGRAPETFPEPV